jgi:ferredoxin/flavodoxin---NADP+ reductase
MLNNFNKIIKKSILSKDIISLEVYNDIVAAKALAGQFVVVRATETGERIPLTIADSNKAEGIINLTILKRGKSTHLLADLNVGDVLCDVAGPLGKNTQIENFGTVAIIGGGVGIAPTLPIIKAMEKAGNYVISILGAKTGSELIFEDIIKDYSSEFYICTDDGSKGYKGFVSGFFSDYLKKNPERIVSRVVAIGPALMMKAVSDITRPYGIYTVVSLNPIMVDGTGMCGSCRVEVDKKTKFACVDGPEFDGHLVDFGLLLDRLNIYCNEENAAFKEYTEKHKCKMI